MPPVGERSIRVRLSTLAAVAAGAALLACGGDFTGSDDALRQGEAEELATIMAEQVSRVLVAQVEQAPRSDTEVEVASQVLFNRGGACPAGGSAVVTGTVSRSSPVGDDLLTLDFRASLVHDSCGVSLGGRGVTLVGGPGVTVEGIFERDESVLVGPQQAQLTGGIRWSPAGSANASGGACEVDLETTLTDEGENLRAAGRVCGFRVDRSVSVIPPSTADDGPDRS